MDRNLTLEAVRLTEAAALNASRMLGKGDDNASYAAASDAMFKVFSHMNITGEVIIGSNSSDDSLFDGLQVGNGLGDSVDIAVKPLDGKNTCARGGYNAISAVAIGGKNSFLRLPSRYMDKIAVGSQARGCIDINAPVDINIKRVARAKKKYIEDITVCVLDREVNQKLVHEIRKTGARIIYLLDGDISAAISSAMNNSSIDMLMGVGGTKEGIISAAALRCFGGDFQAKLSFLDYDERKKTLEQGFEPDRIYTQSDLICGDDITVSLTGVTDGVILKGVKYFAGGAETNSIVFRHKTHTIRFVNAIHHFDYKPIF